MTRFTQSTGEKMTTTIDDLYTELQPISTGAMAKYNYSLALEKKFTCESRFNDTYTTFRTDYKHIWVPRAVAPIGDKDLRVTGMKCGMKSYMVPRNEKQVRILDQAKPMLDAGESFIIRAATGVGKTACALDLIAHVNVPTLVIVPKDDLMTQWYKEIKQFLKLPDSRIGMIQGDICNYQNKWVVLAMLHSISKDARYPKEMYKYFGMICWDEVHRLAAETFSDSGCAFPAKIRLGLSATPERADGKEALIEAHIGPVRITEDGDPMKFKVLRYYSTWECPRHPVKADNGTTKYVRVRHSAGKCGHITNMIAGHKPDQKMIASWAKTAYTKGRHTIVFSDRTEHLQELMRSCRAAGIPSAEMGLYLGTYEKDGKKIKMSREQKEVSKGKKVIFATYGAMKEGTDIPWFDTIIFATPRSDVKQAVGRIIREYDDKKRPTVFDIIHEDSPVFLGYAQKREDYYKEKGAEVKELN
jgi:superfamily II DNA or RNA helicase